jgi:Fe2+ transport system protein B
MYKETKSEEDNAALGNAKAHGKTTKKQKKPKGEKEQISKTNGKTKKTKKHTNFQMKCRHMTPSHLTLFCCFLFFLVFQWVFDILSFSPFGEIQKPWETTKTQ